MDTITPMSLQPHKSMDTGALKKFAQEARRTLRDQVSTKLVQVLAENSAARREAPKAVQQLESEIGRTSRDQVIERVAYTWFNRFTALRFMDVNGYTPVGVVTPADGQTRPEILSEATAGVISEEVREATASQIRALLDGRAPSNDPQGEAYRLLLVAACNHWHGTMPFLFETIADYTELLMPEDLLSAGSILAKLRAVMTADICHDVEVIGWLYQFYIAEKKDEVFAGLKKNVKIVAENIPAATQLFTPHWIVRYLVENSLGRLWLLNRPSSRLRERMGYYIAPDEPETDFLRISSPQEIKVCDPACGSGHMLTYAFDLLYAIYEEEGFDAAEIPGLILANNLYGIEIDERAGALAAFALTMKAAGHRKRFLRRAGKDGVQPKICVLENVSFKYEELTDYVKEVGQDLFTTDLRATLEQFHEAKNFGSLIVPVLKDAGELGRVIAEKQFENNLFLRDVHERVRTAVRMADYLSPKYHVVIANPPYMGGKGMNGKLAEFSKAKYPDSKADLFAMFMERALRMSLGRGMMAMINMQSWMFLASFEKLRTKLLADATILSMAHLGERAFDTISGSVVSTTAFILENARHARQKGEFIRLVTGGSEAEKSSMLVNAINNRSCGWLFKASAADFERVAGSPISYWLSSKVMECFELPPLSTRATFRAGLQTGDNDRFLRFWHEVAVTDLKPGCASREAAIASGATWFPHNKGGGYRKWYGNNDYIIKWRNDGEEIKRKKAEDLKNGLITANNAKCWNQEFYFLDGLTWSSLSSSEFSLRANGPGFLFDTKGQMLFPQRQTEQFGFLGLLNSNVASTILEALSPTLDFNGGVVAKLPLCDLQQKSVAATELRDLSKADWDSYESSWDFRASPLLAWRHRETTLEGTYASLLAHWRMTTERVRRLEEENNRIFIDAYGLQEELTPEVAIEEVTLICNPAYRYGGEKAQAVLEELLRADTVKEFVSYAVGCMFGRYSLDAPGLILANQGEGLDEYRAKVPEPTFEPDADNVIPILGGDWFADDIVARFRGFLRATFGEPHFQENLAFVEEALGKDIRRYFLREFFSDHVKRYRKRPIYWLFSSPKGSFNALIYMHRYRPDTVSVVLNDYLREFRSKLEAHRRGQEALSINGDASPAQRTKALKEIEATGRQIEELDAWERDVLFPLATQKIEIDLNDGVKANYPKFGAALKPIKGLNDADD